MTHIFNVQLTAQTDQEYLCMNIQMKTLLGLVPDDHVGTIIYMLVVEMLLKLEYLQVSPETMDAGVTVRRAVKKSLYAKEILMHWFDNTEYTKSTFHE